MSQAVAFGAKRGSDDKPGATRIPKAARVKNKTPAAMQITAEQILQEVTDRQLEKGAPPPKQPIRNEEELRDYKMRKRKTFEDNIRKNRGVISNWIKYAEWEAGQKEIQRAESVFERALDEDHRNIGLWLKYAEMEMKNGQVNHARNLWNRGVTILPRADQFWFKFAYMEEMLGEVGKARQVFERWMEWEPQEQAWFSYIKMEMRYKEVERARKIYERFVQVHPVTKYWIKYAKFEEENGYLAAARNVYERGMEFFGDEHTDESFYMAFAKYEERQKEFERVRTIYKYAIDKLGKEKCTDLFKAYSQFEKRHGDRLAIDDVITSKRRLQYEEQLALNSRDYDLWFNYIRLMEGHSDVDLLREIYERAIANIPPIQEKRYWRRYIYLWINYALFEELAAKDMERTREVYKAALSTIPHRIFTFAKIWIMYSHFEVRQLELNQARKILGNAIGMCPKTKLYRGYIELELELREFGRARILYEKFLEFNPSNCTTWIKYAELESILGDVDRTRAIFELATEYPSMDIPEILWKAYIDFEVELEDWERVRALYERLLDKTKHIKVWLSYAKFEASIEELENTRAIFGRADKLLKELGRQEERKSLHDLWLTFGMTHGDEACQFDIQKEKAKRVKNRHLPSNEGGATEWEEYWEYVFPDEGTKAPNLKLLEMAKKWKKGNEEALSNV
ncbi:Crooked neck-like protein 1 [Oopsacas minuta]|uniref:Crooked neck-like protein 1 n=1 Tax=Oopsacas minuta TaxID=111878 RepID=A0AAV7JXY2_9METZ|nr:Crooked neck-like protein 1 [Oopsacas minuta]